MYHAVKMILIFAKWVLSNPINRSSSKSPGFSPNFGMIGICNFPFRKLIAQQSLTGAVVIVLYVLVLLYVVRNKSFSCRLPTARSCTFSCNEFEKLMKKGKSLKGLTLGRSVEIRTRGLLDRTKRDTKLAHPGVLI